MSRISESMTNVSGGRVAPRRPRGLLALVGVEDGQSTSLLPLHTPLLQQALSVLADVAVAPDRQIRVEVHSFRQSLESFQVQLTKIKIQRGSRHATSW